MCDPNLEVWFRRPVVLVTFPGLVDENIQIVDGFLYWQGLRSFPQLTGYKNTSNYKMLLLILWEFVCKK